jgi:exodeoxyribonuclease I
MRMAQVVAACVPNAITVPIEGKCKRTFKLALVAEANGIRLDNAHEALADAGATLALARLLKLRAPQIWRALVTNARKAKILQLIEYNPVLLLSETFFGTSFNMMVAPISVSCSNPNEWALFDLQFDPEQLLTAADGTLRDAIDGNVKKIRRVSANAQPPLLSTEFTPADVRGGRLPMETYLERARKVRENRVFQQRISRLLAERYVDQRSSIYVEQRIYDGFPSRDDEARLATFHRQEWSHRVGLVPSIEDDRCRELSERTIFVEEPAVLTDAQRRSWQGWHRDRVLAAGKTPWLTIAGALNELEGLVDATPEQQSSHSDIRTLLGDLERVARSGSQ